MGAWPEPPSELTMSDSRSIGRRNGKGGAKQGGTASDPAAGNTRRGCALTDLLSALWMDPLNGLSLMLLWGSRHGAGHTTECRDR
jgi:hypothetical protein